MSETGKSPKPENLREKFPALDFAGFVYLANFTDFAGLYNSASIYAEKMTSGNPFDVKIHGLWLSNIVFGYLYEKNATSESLFLEYMESVCMIFLHGYPEADFETKWS